MAAGNDITHMAQRIIKNRAASNRVKLLNIARAEKIDFDGLLLRFMQERLLHRLSLSKYKSRFVLKGGLLLTCYDLPFLRATKDIDFLAKEVDSRPDLMKKMFTEILKRQYDDGVDFDMTSIAAENIKKGSDYVGIRIKLKAKLEQAVKTLQIDVGFGDVIIPKPVTMAFPTILDEAAPKIGVYSKESIISEKFEAMIKLSTINSRFKDFYDIYALSAAYSFDGSVLKSAIAATFKRRKTALPKRPLVFGPDFARDNNRQKQWLAFIRKSKMAMNLDFETVMTKISDFLSPVVVSINGKQEMASHWDHTQKIWT